MIKMLAVLAVLVSTTVAAQTGSVRGQVTDARTGEVLVGANIIVVDSRPGHGAATDLNGMYLMARIPPGEYAVRASYLDYQTVTAQSVNVAIGHATEVNFALRKEGEEAPVDKKPADTLSVPGDSTRQVSAGSAK
jgi:hypothetical protein